MQHRGKGLLMPELMVDFITSLDGYASAEGWPGWWGLEGPEYLAWLASSPERDYTVLMGATTYRLMSSFAEADADDRASRMTETSKVVFSSTLKEPLSWANTRLVDEDPVEAVRSMKEEGSAAAHARQPHPVPVAARGRPRRPLPGGRLPGHHRQHRAGAHLRRVPRRRPRNGRQPDVRRPAPAARVRARPCSTGRPAPTVPPMPGSGR